MAETILSDIPEVLMLDLGNVLIDLEIERFHRDVVKRLRRHIVLDNEEFHHSYMAGHFDENTMRQKIEQKYGLFLSGDSFSTFWSAMLGRDRVELLPYLDKLRGEMKLALCSNTDDTHIQFLKNRKSPMVEEFDHYCYSYELGYVKPDEAYFIAALKKISVPAKKCLFLDDNKANTEAASGLGIPSIHTPDIESLIKVFEVLLQKE